MTAFVIVLLVVGWCAVADTAYVIAVLLYRHLHDRRRGRLVYRTLPASYLGQPLRVLPARIPSARRAPHAAR